MKFTCSVEIDKAIAEVVEAWKDENNYAKWQEGFKSKELLEGQKWEKGAKSKINLGEGKRKMVLIETVINNDLPNEFKTFVEHIHMDNTQTVRFKSLANNKTLYSSEIEYTSFKHFIPRLMAKLFPNMFINQVQKWLDNFKEFVEA